jgi:DNA-binding CsgD family transcriptional regulator
LRHPVVNCLFEDSQHRLWIGTHGGGLHRFDPETQSFSVKDVQDGLLSNVIKGITEDLEGYLWISTNQGVSRLDTETGTFHNYTRHDGLQGGEYSRNGILTDQEGYIYLGGSTGFDRFHPANLRKNQHVPEVHLTQLTFDNQKVPIDPEGLLPKHPNHLGELVLPYWRNDFSLSYVGLDYSSPQLVTYAYRLIGYDDQWQAAGSRRTAHYTNLDPGSYTFEVRAANSDGLWTANPKVLHIVITPPWWATIWFRLLALGSILAAVFAAIWWREQATLRQKKRLERLVNERTLDLRQANEVLSAQKQQIETQKEEIQRQSQITLKVQQEINRLKQEQLEGQIDLKNRELAAQALHIVQKNEFLSKLGQEVEQVFGFLPDKYHGKMKEVSRELQQSMRLDTEWDNFKLSFERVHPDFFKRLSKDFPQLTQNDLKQCAFIRMGLAKKEIATMLHVTPRGVTMARNRIKKKLGLGAEDDLRAFINQQY